MGDFPFGLFFIVGLILYFLFKFFPILMMKKAPVSIQVAIMDDFPGLPIKELAGSIVKFHYMKEFQVNNRIFWVLQLETDAPLIAYTDDAELAWTLEKTKKGADFIFADNEGKIEIGLLK